MKEIRFLKESVPVFRAAAEETLQGLLRAEESRKIVVEKGGFLCRSGEPLEGLLVITAGRAQVRRDSVLLRELSAGDVTGVSALYSGEPRMETDIQARTRVTALFFPREAMTQALRSDPQLAADYIVFLSTRIRFLNGIVRRFSASDATARVARWLLTQSEAHGLIFPLSPTRAAAELGIARASFYRALDYLQSEGFIRREGRDAVLEEPDRLRAMLGET